MIKSEEFKYIYRKYFICLIGLLVLIVLLFIKTSVNNHITDLYFIISVAVVAIISIILPVLIRKEIPTQDKIKSQKRLMTIVWEICDFFALFIIVCCLFQALFVFGYFKADVSGPSMFPTLHNDDILIVRSTSNVENFDIVVVDRNDEEHGVFYTDDRLLVKRLIGKGGDVLEVIDGEMYVNNHLVPEEYVNPICSRNISLNLSNFINRGVIYDSLTGKYIIQEGYYYVLGDNRCNSTDSRFFGPFLKSQIVGKVVYRINSLFDWEKINGEYIS